MLKKILFIVFLFFFCTTGYSQTEKGNWIISTQGNAQFDINSPALFESSLRIKASAQKLIMQNLGFGISVLSSLPGADFFSMETGPFIRQYFGKYDVKPYLELSPGIKYRDYSSHNDTDFFIKPGLGLIYWFHKHIGVDTNVNLDLINTPADWQWNFGVNVSF